MADRRALRPAGFDDLGLRRALGDRMLPLLVGAMAFLAALALAGAVGAAALAGHWREGAASAVTVQVPQPAGRAADAPEQARLDRVVALLHATAGVASARALPPAELADLLRPWLGDDAARLSLPVPGVVAVHLGGGDVDLGRLRAQLAAAAPGTLVEDHGIWAERLTLLARSLQACAALILLVVAGVASAVITVATRAGLLARREAIEIVHGLGATDGYVAGRFARRASALAARGGLAGALLALPVLLAMARLAAPFAMPDVPEVWDARVPDWLRALAVVLASLPGALWLALPALPVASGVIGFATAHLTVRRWLRRLP